MIPEFSSTHLCILNLKEEIIMKYCLVTVGMLRRISCLQHTCTQQLCYNQVQMSRRGLVKRMFGRVAYSALKTLRFKPSRCCTVIIATAVLHNYLKKQGCPDPPIEEDDNPDVPPFTTNHREGLAYRDAFALCHFK